MVNCDVEPVELLRSHGNYTADSARTIISGLVQTNGGFCHGPAPSHLLQLMTCLRMNQYLQVSLTASVLLQLIYAERFWLDDFCFR